MSRIIRVRWNGRAYIGEIPDGIREYPVTQILEASMQAKRKAESERTRYAALTQYRLGLPWGASLGAKFTPDASSSVTIQVAATNTKEAQWGLSLSMAQNVLDAATSLLSEAQVLEPGLLQINRADCRPDYASPHALTYVTAGLVWLLDNDQESRSDEAIASSLDDIQENAVKMLLEKRNAR